MSGDDEKAAERVARQFIERNRAIEALRMLNELADVGPDPPSWHETSGLALAEHL